MSASFQGSDDFDLSLQFDGSDSMSEQHRSVDDLSSWLSQFPRFPEDGSPEVPEPVAAPAIEVPPKSPLRGAGMVASRVKAYNSGTGDRKIPSIFVHDADLYKAATPQIIKSEDISVAYGRQEGNFAPPAQRARLSVPDAQAFMRWGALEKTPLGRAYTAPVEGAGGAQVDALDPSFVPIQSSVGSRSALEAPIADASGKAAMRRELRDISQSEAGRYSGEGSASTYHSNFEASEHSYGHASHASIGREAAEHGYLSEGVARRDASSKTLQFDDIDCVHQELLAKVAQMTQTPRIQWLHRELSRQHKRCLDRAKEDHGFKAGSYFPSKVQSLRSSRAGSSNRYEFSPFGTLSGTPSQTFKSHNVVRRASTGNMNRAITKANIPTSSTNPDRILGKTRVLDAIRSRDPPTSLKYDEVRGGPSSDVAHGYLNKQLTCPILGQPQGLRRRETFSMKLHPAWEPSAKEGFYNGKASNIYLRREPSRRSSSEYSQPEIGTTNDLYDVGSAAGYTSPIRSQTQNFRSRRDSVQQDIFPSLGKVKIDTSETSSRWPTSKLDKSDINGIVVKNGQDTFSMPDDVADNEVQVQGQSKPRIQYKALPVPVREQAVTASQEPQRRHDRPTVHERILRLQKSFQVPPKPLSEDSNPKDGNEDVAQESPPRPNRSIRKTRSAASLSLEKHLRASSDESGSRPCAPKHRRPTSSWFSKFKSSRTFRHNDSEESVRKKSSSRRKGKSSLFSDIKTRGNAPISTVATKTKTEYTIARGDCGEYGSAQEPTDAERSRHAAKTSVQTVEKVFRAEGTPTTEGTKITVVVSVEGLGDVVVKTRIQKWEGEPMTG